MKLKSILIAIPAMFIASSAMAGSWTGVSVGVSVGENSGLNDLNISPGPSVTPGLFNVDLNGLGGTGVFFGLNLHGDYQVNKNVVVGAFASYEKLNDKFDLSGSILGTPFSAEIAEDHRWTIGGRVGYLPTDSTMVYGLLGYTQQSDSSPTFTVPGQSFSASLPDLRGVTIGAGIETNLTANIVLRGEYDYTRFDEATMTLPTIGGTNLNDFVTVTDRATDQAVHIDLAYRFSPAPRGPAAPLK